MTVCQVLESARDGQQVTVRGGVFNRLKFLPLLREVGLEGKPCSPATFFTQPSTLLIVIRRPPDDQRRMYRQIYLLNGSETTLTGVYVPRRGWSALLFRKSDGTFATIWPLTWYVQSKARYEWAILYVTSIDN
jgi:hypothetical protein